MIIARQRHPLSAFTYDLLDHTGQPFGDLSWPDFAVARNGRLKAAVPGSMTTRIHLTCHGQTFQVEYEYLTRDWNNDIRFLLTAAGDVIASASATKPARRFGRFRRHSLTLAHPLSASLVRTSGLFTARYALQVAGQNQGTIKEASGLRLRRELVAELPSSLSAPVQCFLVFLVLNDAYR
jgi:hypothetical protein